MLEVPAGHAATGVARLGAASQALVMAALALEATRAVLTLVRAHLKEEDREKETGKKVNIRFDTKGIKCFYISSRH